MKISMLVNKRKNKRYIIGTLVFACVSLMIIVALTFSYMCEVCNNAIESVTEILLREQAVNDSIASMISTSTMSHMNTKCESKELLGALYTNRNFDTQSCSKINAVTFVENYLSKKTLQNRYYSSPEYGFVYFFNGKKYKKLQPGMYSQVISLTGNFARFLSYEKRKRDILDFWDNHLEFNEIYRDSVSKNLVMTIATPVTNSYTREVIGVMYTDISEDELQQHVFSRSPAPKWVSVTANNISYDRPGSLCATRHCETHALSFKILSQPLAEIFILEANVDLYAFIKENIKIFLAVLMAFIVIVTAAIKAINLFLKTQKHAVIDSLTQVYNRQIISHLSGKDYNSLVIFDCDEFKVINDTHGHLVGDAALTHIASIISDNVRNEDVVVRYGGDEFIVLCTNEKIHARKMAERICSKLKVNPLVFGDLTLPLSISFGVAEFTDDLHTALYKADKALYAQKLKSRSQKVDATN